MEREQTGAIGMASIRKLARKVKENVTRVVVGKDSVIDQLLIALIASGHVLLEDVPGTGKTLLAKSLAASLNCRFKRIQFTPDLLPSDLSGINYYNPQQGAFEFRPGPLFTQILLADEINRATPRTQSSLLECMEERQLSIDGETHRLAAPFLVIATQNPIENQGTFPLPEAQLDRFMMKVKMGYPTKSEGVDILYRFKETNPLAAIAAVAGTDEITAAQQQYHQVYVGREMMEYIVDIAERTRSAEGVAMGVSPRGSQALLKAAQVRAIFEGRDFVQPDDVKAMAVPVLAHRIVLDRPGRAGDEGASGVIAQVLREAPVPAESVPART